MGKIKDLAGKQFSKLIVIKYVFTSKRKAYWLCKCDCGNEKILCSNDLVGNKVKSCGCLKRKIDNNNLKLYGVWNSMKSRCYNSKRNNYKNYGGRGIKVCDEWNNDFMNFYNWAMDNGYDENLNRGECTLDRIDVNDDYKPDNCRWIDIKKQTNNKTNNRLITYNDEIHTMSEWADILKIKYNTLNNRINNLKWTVEKAFTQKVKVKTCC